MNARGLLTVIVMFGFMSTELHAQAETLRAQEAETLKGIKGVYVVIETLKPEIEADGLEESQIQTDVELKLRLAGIKVLTEEEMFKEPGMPYLCVNVNAFKNDILRIYAYNISIELGQLVYLERDIGIGIKHYGITWEISVIGVIREKNVDSIRDSVKNLIDKFINDYLSVNPK
ncbi:unnamed protein product [marine sediment metagenome]|uniref:Uncharacterized protein n=1 Tax=marine sediment metagenome TaxID=412755 RepID=X1M7S5_9ZZZZ